MKCCWWIFYFSTGLVSRVHLMVYVVEVVHRIETRRSIDPLLAFFGHFYLFAHVQACLAFGFGGSTNRLQVVSLLLKIRTGLLCFVEVF